jgi:hypothetical protein
MKLLTGLLYPILAHQSFPTAQPISPSSVSLHWGLWRVALPVRVPIHDIAHRGWVSVRWGPLFSYAREHQGWSLSDDWAAAPVLLHAHDLIVLRVGPEWQERHPPPKTSAACVDCADSANRPRISQPTGRLGGPSCAVYIPATSPSTLGVSRESATHIGRHYRDHSVERGEKALPAYRDLGGYAIAPWAKRASEQHQLAGEVTAALVDIEAPRWPRNFASELSARRSSASRHGTTSPRHHTR